MEVALFTRQYKPFAGIIREKFHSKNPHTNRAVFSAWAAVDAGLAFNGYEVTEEMAQATVKKQLTGNGRADKQEVADEVKRILRLGDDYEFRKDDESDACAIILAYLRREGVISE